MEFPMDRTLSIMEGVRKSTSDYPTALSRCYPLANMDFFPNLNMFLALDGKYMHTTMDLTN